MNAQASVTKISSKSKMIGRRLIQRVRLRPVRRNRMSEVALPFSEHGGIALMLVDRDDDLTSRSATRHWQVADDRAECPLGPGADAAWFPSHKNCTAVSRVMTEVTHNFELVFIFMRRYQEDAGHQGLETIGIWSLGKK